FFREREAHLFERRGYEPGEAKAVAAHWQKPSEAAEVIGAVAKFRGSAEFKALGGLFKRIKNITKDFEAPGGDLADVRARLREPAELALADEIIRRGPAIERALASARYTDVMTELVSLREPVDRFFKDVMVMVDDQALREARLTLLA